MTEMTNERTGSKSTSFSRRKLAQGAAWAVPAAAVSVAAPAYASSKYSYTIRGSVYMGYTYVGDRTCSPGHLTSLTFNNTAADTSSSSPAGFSIYEKARVANTTSPRTTVTLTKYVLTIFIPTGWVDTSQGKNGWYSTSSAGDTNWSGPTVGKAVSLPRGQYTPFYFTYNLTTKTSSTVSASSPITPWPGSNTLNGRFYIKSPCVISGASYYWAYDRAFTTANGDSYSANNNTNPIEAPMTNAN